MTYREAFENYVKAYKEEWSKQTILDCNIDECPFALWTTETFTTEIEDIKNTVAQDIAILELQPRYPKDYSAHTYETSSSS